MCNHPCRFLLIIVLSTMSACSTTRIKGAWVNPSYHGGDIKKILVLGISENETYRRIFEDSLSREINERGVPASPGYTLFPTEKRPARETITKKITDKGFNALLISKVTGRERKEIIQNDDWYDLEITFRQAKDEEELEEE